MEFNQPHGSITYALNVSHKVRTLCIVMSVWIAIEVNTHDVCNESCEATPEQETHLRKQTSHTIVTHSTIRHTDRSTHLYHTRHHVNECRWVSLHLHWKVQDNKYVAMIACSYLLFCIALHSDMSTLVTSTTSGETQCTICKRPHHKETGIHGRRPNARCGVTCSLYD